MLLNWWGLLAQCAQWQQETLENLAQVWKVDPRDAALRILRDSIAGRAAGRQGRGTGVASFNMAQADPPLRRTIKKPQLRQMVPLADSTIWEMERRGEFPKRFLLTPRCVVWDLAEVEAWLERRRNQPIRRAPPPDVRRRVSRPVRTSDRSEAPLPPAH